MLNYLEGYTREKERPASSRPASVRQLFQIKHLTYWEAPAGKCPLVYAHIRIVVGTGGWAPLKASCIGRDCCELVLPQPSKRIPRGLKAK